MSVDKLVDSTQLNADLTTVANAIRTKGGTSAQLSFPSGMAQAIADIPSGTPTQTKSMRIGSAAPTTVIPDSGYALSSVTPSIDTSVIKAANIAQGVTILGIQGSHSGGASTVILNIYNYLNDAILIDNTQVDPGDSYSGTYSVTSGSISVYIDQIPMM